MDITGIREPLIVGIACIGAFFVFCIFAIIRSQRRRLSAGAEVMIGKVAETHTVLNPRGTVAAEGELWTAIAEGSKIEPGEEVIITRVEGLKLWVIKKEKEDK
ncbi:MAG: hypothetical protein KAX25_01165 [Dehalococcoidia bacterium]|nr:hypothetical protein [Chloroflexota bacterium]MCK4221449.1 hypothetical protein [Dehalococcoidia bacterium]